MTNATIIAERYRIEGRLGVGGMSTVHLAFDQRLERNVALKLLAEHLADDPTFVSRFRREALSAARLVHPNIVQVFDFGLDEVAHQHYIVMEHVPGHSCAELLRDRGRLELDEAVDVVSQACRGLDYAHRHGVVHRDVKPGNLLVSDADVVKLADFGIARATDQSSITQVGSVLGTAAYLAPEQARGEEAGPRADIYSLGVVTYQLLSGRLPYEAASLSELALKQQRESPTPLDELNPQVPRALAVVVEAALAIDQTERPSDAIALADALRNGFHGLDPFPGGTATAGIPTRPTRMLRQEPTAATRVAAPVAPAPERSGTRAATGSQRAAQRQAQRTEPRRAPRPAPARARQAQAPAPARRRGRGARRFLLFLLVAVLFAAAVAVAITLAASTSSNVVHFKSVVAHDVNTAISKVQGIINQYTK
jgi:eukaryotic-like serine/threonine-protein kinase